MSNQRHTKPNSQHSTTLISGGIALVTVLLASCGNQSSDNAATKQPLRPGIEDSSKAFKGTPSAAENAFWEAIRNGDDGARQQAVAQLKIDAAKDPSNGYSAFLAAADAFMPLTDLLRAAMSDGPPPKSRAFPDDTVPLLMQGLQHLTDPLYLGFDATLLAGLQAFVDPANAPKTQALAMANNIPASSVGGLNVALRAGDLPGARDVMFGVLEYCSGSRLDHANPDVNGYVQRANAADLVHRECYSGYHATHATEGIMIITGDLVALNGDAALAKRIYTAAQSAANYGTWPLKAVLERRLRGESAASMATLSGVVACSTCHVNKLN